MNRTTSGKPSSRSAGRGGGMTLSEAHVARTLREVAVAGPTPGMVHMVDADYVRIRDEILAAAPPGPLTLFA